MSKANMSSGARQIRLFSAVMIFLAFSFILAASFVLGIFSVNLDRDSAYFCSKMIFLLSAVLKFTPNFCFK